MYSDKEQNLLYDLHHALDPITLPVAGRVLKLACFARARKNFEWDLLNDIGIINLLRKVYLQCGSLEETFNLYQSTRLDNRSHRYESLLALLVVAITGTVVGGLILDIYKDNKAKLAGWLRKIQRENQLFGQEDSDLDIFTKLFENDNRPALLEKFCSITAGKVLADFDVLLKCFVARAMFDQNLLTYVEYSNLISMILKKQDVTSEGELLKRFRAFNSVHQASPDAIRREKVFLAIEAYAKGTVAQRLDEVEIKLPLPENHDIAAVFKGIPASPCGAAAGIAHLLESDRLETRQPTILVADARKCSPENIGDIFESAGVVTTNCRITDHLPVLCRGLGKSCVILSASDFSRIRNGDPVGVCGTTGVVGVGVVVKLPEPSPPRSTGGTVAPNPSLKRTPDGAA